MEIKLTAKGMAVANRNKVDEEKLGKYLTARGVALVKASKKEKTHSQYLVR